MTASKYSDILKQVIYNVGKNDRHNQLINILKESFRDDINSPRRYEQTRTIGQLLKILEIRDVLSEDNLEPLKLIARKLDNDEILSGIADYEASHVKSESINYYAIENKESEKILDSHTFHTTSNPYVSISEQKRKRIFDTLKEEIGTYWRDLGRNLNIREYVIEEIDKGNHSLYEKASKLVIEYERKADPQKWFFNLCTALDKSRRKDLSRNLHEIMMMNI